MVKIIYLSNITLDVCCWTEYHQGRRPSAKEKQNKMCNLEKEMHVVVEMK